MDQLLAVQHDLENHIKINQLRLDHNVGDEKFLKAYIEGLEMAMYLINSKLSKSSVKS